MLLKLTLKNCFKHANRTINFETGLTAITGPNETGKSLILEMIRYALFGSKALRGKASEYGEVEVELEFRVLGDHYRVFRKGDKARLWKNETDLANGTTPVNLRIRKILGYGLDVFDVANCALQKKLTDLTDDMKPSERLTMVDNVVGLTVIDTLKGWIGDQLSTARGQIGVWESVAAGTMMPDVPVCPEGYLSEEVFAEEQKRLLALVEQYREATGVIQMAPPHPGDAPTWRLPRPAAEYQSLLVDLQRAEQDYEAIRPYLMQQAPQYDMEWVLAREKEHEAYNNYQAVQRELSQYVDPKFTNAELDLHQVVHTSILPLVAESQLLQRQLAALENSPLHTCPECKTQFHDHDDEIRKLQAQIDSKQAELDQLPEEVRSLYYSKTYIAESNIQSLRTAIHIWEQQKPYVEQLKATPAVAAPTTTLQQIEQMKAALDHHYRVVVPAHQRGQALQDRIRSVREQIMLDPVILQQDLTMYLQNQTVWEQKTALYNQMIPKVQAAKEFLSRQANPSPLLDVLYANHHASRNYDKAVQQYAEVSTRLAEANQHLATLQLRIENLSSAREAINDTKIAVKKYLVPSLNKVASHLVSTMTNGARSHVLVDENFNITVDGQPVYALSGSGRSVTNLAVRLALGQVLTNKRFSIFMADEIDGDMDADRAEYTHQALKNLGGTIQQILLVSHKPVEADHYVTLGKGRVSITAP